MTRVHQFIAALRQAGFSVTTDGNLLWISPRARLTTCDQTFILANRPDIIAAVEAENAATFIRLDQIAGDLKPQPPQVAISIGDISGTNQDEIVTTVFAKLETQMRAGMGDAGIPV